MAMDEEDDDDGSDTEFQEEMHEDEVDGPGLLASETVVEVNPSDSFEGEESNIELTETS